MYMYIVTARGLLLTVYTMSWQITALPCRVYYYCDIYMHIVAMIQQ